MKISLNLHFQVILQVHLRWPLTLICDLLTPWTYEGSHIISINQVWFKLDFNFSNEAIFTFSAYLTTWSQMTFDLGIWPLTKWTYEGSHITSITIGSRLQLFKWGHFHIFSLSYNLTSDDLWPWHMTFDGMNTWRFQNYIDKPSLVPIGLQLFKWGHFHTFSLSYWKLDLRWPLTLMWPLTSSTNEGSHVASMTQLWLKSIKACGS